ncbi:MAG: SdrD B-like domain-containing protein [Pirellulaceae bacterium]
MWHDLNANGVQDVGEPGVDDVIVELFDANRALLLDSTKTSRGGRYAFYAVPEGDYIVQITADPIYDPTLQDQSGDDSDSDVDPLTWAASVSLGAGERTIDVDVGLVENGTTSISIGNFVWHDINGDGIQDVGEPGLDGVAVELFDAEARQKIAETITGDGGQYAFDFVSEDSSYYLRFVRPVGFSHSPNDVGLDDLDSDIDSITGLTPPFQSNTTIANLDAGFIEDTRAEVASLGNRVWNDLNRDGIQDPSEPGVEGVLVRLVDESGSVILNSVRTTAEGQYRFSGLAPGYYFVDVVAPLGHSFSAVNQSTSDVDSDVNEATGRSSLLSVSPGEFQGHIDAGIFQAAPSYVVASSSFVGVLPDDDPDGLGSQTQMGRDAFVTISDAVLGLDTLPGNTPLQLLDETYEAFAYDRPDRVLHLITPAGESTISQATIVQGTLLVDGAFRVPSGVYIDDGAMLAGSGTIDGNVAIDGGTLSPGFSPGMLHTGSLQLGGGAIYSVEINGGTPGAAGYDQTIVSGSVDLSDSQLSLSLGYVPDVGDQFLILDNDGVDEILGTFADLGEGQAIYLGSNLEAVISYMGGSGNDIELTVRIADAQPPTLIGFTRHLPSGQFTNADSLEFYAEFSEPVTQIDPSDFEVAGDTTANIESAQPVSGTGETIFLVTVSGGDLPDFNGAIGLNLAAFQNIEDAVGNALPDGEPETDQAYMLDNVAPKVNHFVVDDGSAQRSVVRSLTYEFDSPIVYSVGAFALETSAGQTVPFSLDISPGVLADLFVFSFPGLTGGSLSDGNYRLLVDESLITDAAGNNLDGNYDGSAGGARAVDEFFRFFGDYDGDRDVDAADYVNFRRTYRRNSSSSLFNSAFDFDADGIVDGSDYIEFRRRYRRTLP